MEEKILGFFNAVQDLKKAGIIRSDKYLGDIGEYICEQLYKIKLSDSKREKGYDGIAEGKKYQVKFHNSQTRTNIYLGKPKEYDIVLVVLGPESLLRKGLNCVDSFIVYKFTSSEVEKFKNKSGYCCGKAQFKEDNIDKKYNIPSLKPCNLQ